MRRPKFPEVKRCYECGNVAHGFIIGEEQKLPARLICEGCISKMHKEILAAGKAIMYSVKQGIKEFEKEMKK